MVKLFIGNLPDGNVITNDDIRPMFESLGTVTECEVIRNYGFVHMDSEEAAEAAIAQLNGTDVKGRPMKVEKSESKGPKKPSTKLFIGNVADGTTNEQLKGLFESYGEVMEADVIAGKNYGFIHIDSSIGRGKINEIVRELNGYELNGNKIRVQQSTSGVRGQPGMNGDGCFRCGRGGHWSKECPGMMMGYGPPRGGPRGRGMGMGPPRGGYMRDAPYPPRGGGYGGGRGGGGPMRNGRGGGGYGGGGYGGGGGGYGGGGYGGGRGGGGYGGGRGGDGGGYGGGRGGGGRGRGGYSSGGGGGGYNSGGYSSDGYGSGGYEGGSGGYSSGGGYGSGGDMIMFSRRSPGGAGGGYDNGGGYGGGGGY